MTNWMRGTRWAAHFRDARLDILIALSSVPKPDVFGVCGIRAEKIFRLPLEFRWDE